MFPFGRLQYRQATRIIWRPLPTPRGRGGPIRYTPQVRGCLAGILSHEAFPSRQRIGNMSVGIQPHKAILCHQVTRSISEYIGERSVPRRSTVPPSYGGRVGGNPVQQSKAVPPSYEEYIGGADDGDGVPSAHIGAAVTQAEPSDSGVVRVERRRKHWAMFVAGNLISAGVLISEITQLDICFDGFVDDVDDDGISSAEREEEIASDASITNGIMMFTLIFGLWVEVFSATTLSLIYRSPLVIKSVHKIPSDDMRSCGASVIIHFLAPFSWAVIYLFGGLASIYFSTNSSCGGQGGSGVELYLALSGIAMTFGGLLMIAVSTLILFFSCGSPTRLTDRCCAACRKKVNKFVLSKGPYVDIFYQLQGSVWSYRTGGFNLLTFILVGASGVLGEVLAACGSREPDTVQELAGPLG